MCSTVRGSPAISQVAGASSHVRTASSRRAVDSELVTQEATQTGLPAIQVGRPAAAGNC